MDVRLIARHFSSSLLPPPPSSRLHLGHFDSAPSLQPAFRPAQPRTSRTLSMDETQSIQWTGSFSLLPQSIVSQKRLQGDKIILPQSALEELLARAPTSNATATATPRAAHYSDLYQSSFNSVSSSGAFTDGHQQLPHPLMFRLVNPVNGNVVNAGIREFSAPDKTIGLSPFLANALGVKLQDAPTTDGDTSENAIDLTVDASPPNLPQIVVHAKQQPKGTYVRLRPLEAGYNPDDWKSLLERQLRESFTTLTKNTVLAVRGVQGEMFQFLADKFTPDGDGICVVDTDLEVDIEALDEEQARETMRQIMSKAQPGSSLGSSQGGEIDIWKDVHGQVLPGEYVDYTLPSWNRSQTLSLAVQSSAPSYALDLFATPKSAQQRSLPRDSMHVFGDFSEAQHGVKRVTIAPTNVQLDDAESILVSVRAYRTPSETDNAATPIQFTLRAMSVESNNGRSEAMEIEEEHSPDDEQCKNCHQWVPSRTMVLHESFCRRNNVVCPHCDSVFKKGSAEWEEHWHCLHDTSHGSSALSKAKHDTVFHSEGRSCPSCEFTTNSLPDLARHQTSVCPGKIILCRFCHLEVPQEGDPWNPSPEVVLSGMTAHELADGARTTECHLCDKIVRLRDMQMHLQHHELDKAHRAKPTICRNINCGRTLHGVGPRGQIDAGTANGQGPGNDIGLCSICFGPLYVSMHDPEGKALRRRVERRYLGQMMTGCGKGHCGNEWCKTGRSNTDLAAKGSSASAVLPLVKPLLGAMADPAEAMYFCVDEASQQRRKLAEMMASEGVWDLEWCVAAAEAERGNLDKTRAWLQAWAPRK